MHTQINQIQLNEISEITDIKKYIITALSIYFLIVFLPSIYYNMIIQPKVIPEEANNFMYLGSIQILFVLLTLYALINVFLIKNINRASIIIVAVSLIANIAAILATKGNNSTYMFIIIFGATVFTLLSTRTALMLYLLSAIVTLYLCYFVNNSGPETTFNIIVAVVVSSGLFYAFSISNQIALRKLINSSRIDELTGLWNRKMFNEVLEKELKISNRTKLPVTLIIGDIDHFKKVNDEFGHDIGDEILKSISKVLSESIRSTDTVARWGGEEFAFILPNTTMEGTVEVINKIMTSLHNMNHDKVNNITMSFGLSSYILDEDHAKIFKRADDALYESKNTGRDKYMIK